jgi:hypothetical protein
MMRHQIFEVETFKEGNRLHQKIFLYSQCNIMTPLNRKLVYLYEKDIKLFSYVKTNILFLKILVFFLVVAKPMKSQ